MWLIFAFISATLLGFYDGFKKHSLKDNDVLMVLFLNTLFSSIIFLPAIWYAPFGGWEVQKFVVLKSFIVLSSWILGYFAMKYLPLTLVGPINATRPVMVLLGALLIFGERLNMFQWIGVTIAVISFYLLKLGGKKEGIDFWHNRWIFALIGATVLGAVSGLYDKYLMAPVEDGGLGLNRFTVQGYFNYYQFFLMAIILTLPLTPSRGGGLLSLWKKKPKTVVASSSDQRTSVTNPPSGEGTRERAFQWRWTIPFISIFICLADLAYFYSLSLDGAMISIVSMVRRSSVIVSFMVGAFLFHERNIKSKAIDLLLILLSMILLYIGTIY